MIITVRTNSDIIKDIVIVAEASHCVILHKNKSVPMPESGMSLLYQQANLAEFSMKEKNFSGIALWGIEKGDHYAFVLN